MTYEETQNTIREIIYEHINNEEDHIEITPKTRLNYTFGFDSLDIVEMVMKMEHAFKIAITEEEQQMIYTQPFSVWSKIIYNKMAAPQTIKTTAEVIQPTVVQTKQPTLDERFDELDKTLAQFWKESAKRAEILDRKISYTK